MLPSIELLLSNDHEAIDGLYEKYLESKTAKSNHALRAFQSYTSALLHHIKCEEELIFPALSRTPMERAAQEVPNLLEEHQIIFPLLSLVESQLAQGIDSTSAERKLFEELHEHNAREEMHVYSPLDRLLSESEKKSVMNFMETRNN